MVEFYGDFLEELPNSNQFLVISFSPGSVPLQQRWRNNGLSADFVADYLTSFFPASEDDPPSLTRQADLKGAVSFIANELLENSMKFHDESSHESIRFGIHLFQDVVVLFSVNCIPQRLLASLQEVIHELISNDPADLYVRHLEQLAEDDNHSSSGLGLITIMNDYWAKIGWKIDQRNDPNNQIEVTTMVQIKV